MQKQTSIYISKPCHEDWNKMTPTQQGKFCSACSKQVIDFSLMSDTQILNFISHQSEKLCGHFDAEQLQRPLVETKIKKKKSLWMAFTMPLLFLFDRSEAQREVYINTDSTVNANAIKNSLKSYPLDLEYYPSKQITIKGKVVDAENNPIAYATIMQKGTKHGTVSDSLGNFSININTEEDSVTLAASFVGFETIEKRIEVSENKIAIKMNMKPAIAGEVVVVGYISKSCRRTTGLMSTITRITALEKIDSSVKKAIGISNVFPNPVMRGNSIHLKIKNAGDYQMQLLDNNSRLIQAEEINVDTKNSTKQIQLSSNITAGVYYLRLINEQTKKSYTEKLLFNKGTASFGE